ncbi:MAG: PAS domain S-box protein, partial [Syntrophobacterales bacterium]
NHFGWPKEVALGQNYYKLLQTAFPEPLLEMERVLLEQGYWEGELTHTNLHGQRLVMSSRWTLKRDDKGREVAILEISQDVTAQKQIEKEIHRLASFPLLNPTPVLEADEKGKVTYANPAARQVAEKLRLDGGVQAFLPPDLKGLFAKARKGGPRQYSYDLALKDLVFAVNLSFPHDLPTVRLYAMEVTERRRAQEALRESREDLNRAQAVAHTGCWRLNVRRNELTWSDETYRIFGIPPGTPLTYESFLAPVHPEDREFVDQKWMGALRGEAYDIEHRLMVDGQVKWVRERAELEVDDHGQLLGGFGTTQDITEVRRAQEALRDSEERYRSLFENNHAVMLLIDPETADIVDANPAARVYYGLSREELLDKKITDLNTLAPEEVFQEMQRAKAEERKHFEFRHRLAAGEVRDVEVFSGPIRIKGRELLYSIVHDDTARKQAEAALRESEAQFRSLFESMTEGVALHEIIFDDQGTAVDYRILATNPAFTIHTGLKPEQVQGQLASRAYGTEEAPYLEIFARVAELGEPITFDTVFPPLQRYFSISVTSPKTGHFVTVFEDITKRKEAEEALRESQARYRAIGELIPYGIWTADADGSIKYLSTSFLKMAGKTLEECQGYGWLYLLPQEDIQPTLAAWQYCQETRGFWDYEHKIRGKDGRYHTILSRGLPLADSQGRITSWVGINLDISERKEMEEALRRAHNELEERVAERTSALRLANEQLLWEIEERQETEDRLRESEARFTAFMEHLPGLAVMRDVQGCYVFANKTWERLMGKTRDDWQGKNLEELWPREMASKYQQLDQQVLLAGEPMEALETLELADGLHNFLSYRFPIKDMDGLPYMVGAVGIDITRRIQAEEEVLHQTRLFEAFFDHAITPLVFLDPHFNFIRVNQAYARACHREVEDFAGRSHFDLYPSDAKLIFEEVVRGKNPYVAVARPFEFPDHPEWGISYWDWSLTPILNEAGEVDFLVFSLKDVTEQVHAEEERRRLVEILENTPDFVGIADFYGRLQYLNRAGRAMVGVGQEEDVGQLRVLQLHPDWIGEFILQEGAPTARREGSWQAEIALLHRDGREIPVSQVILAHKEATGRVQFFSTIARDISDLKQAQENIIRQSAILNGINRIFREALTSETEEELGRTCLAVAEELTDSRFGFIDELNEEGTFDALAFSDPGWDLCSMPNITEPRHLKDIKPLGLLGRPFREGKTLITNDPAFHQDAAGTPAGHPPLTAFLGVPLISGERTIGLIGLGNKPGGYSRDDQGTLETLAPSIVEALMHHQAKRDLQRSESKLRHLADQLLTAQENERKRLAAELHDELGHALLTLKLALSSIAKELLPGQENIEEEIQEQLAYINDVIGEVRRLYHDLSPGDVEDLGLTKALQTLIEDFANHQPHIKWEVDLPDLKRLFTQPVQTIIYRLVQEALTNIGKHANPEHVNISAVSEGSQVHFVIQDDGAGFDMIEVLESASGLGLVAMEERLNMLGGSFVVWSKRKEGTRLSFSIPTVPEDER